MRKRLIIVEENQFMNEFEENESLNNMPNIHWLQLFK